MEIKIEKNVPCPKNFTKYPFDEMDVGDSFFVEAQGKTINAALISWKRRKKNIGSGKKFIRRTVNGGQRVWRIE